MNKQRKFYLPLFWKFAVAIVVIVLLFGSINEYIISTTVKTTLEKEYKRRGLYIIKNLAGHAISSLLFEDYITLQNQVNLAKNLDTTVIYAFVLDNKNRVLVHTFDKVFPDGLKDYNFCEKQAEMSYKYLKPKGKNLVILDIAMPLLNGELGTIRLGISETAIASQISKAAFNFRMMVVIFLLFGIISALVFANIITRPIRRIRTTAEKIYLNSTNTNELPKVFSRFQNATKFHVDFHTLDEIDLLVIEFNKMISRLENAHFEIEKSQKILLHSEKLATLGQMSASLAHEINNPIAGIKNCIKRLEKNPENIEQNVNYLILMNEATEKIERVVRNYLNFSRIEDVHFDNYLLSDIIANSLMFVSLRLEKNNILIENNITPADLKIYCSARHIEQVFINLLINAIDSIEDKTKIENNCVKKISINAITDDKTTILISDSGMGIDPEKLESIFDPFFTTKEIGSGTGLGLSIVSNIINLHKGTISVTSTTKIKTVFSINL